MSETSNDSMYLIRDFLEYWETLRQERGSQANIRAYGLEHEPDLWNNIKKKDEETQYFSDHWNYYI